MTEDELEKLPDFLKSQLSISREKAIHRKKYLDKEYALKKEYSSLWGSINSLPDDRKKSFYMDVRNDFNMTHNILSPSMNKSTLLLYIS